MKKPKSYSLLIKRLVENFYEIFGLTIKGDCR